MTSRKPATVGASIMSKSDRVQNPLPSWLKDVVPVPLALLHSYRALGMNDGELIYVLQILSDFVQGKTPNHREIAARMGLANRRTLRKYNQHLASLGLATVVPQFSEEGRRMESGYDFTPLFEACHITYQAEQLEQLARLQAIDELLVKITEAHERGESVLDLLDELFQLRKGIGTQDPIGYRNVGSYTPIGTQDPMGIGTQDPIPPGSYDPIPSRGRGIGTQDPILTTTTKQNRSKPNGKDLSVVVSTLLNGNERLQAVYDWSVKAGVAGFSFKMIEILEMDPDPELVRAHAIDRLAAVAIGEHTYAPGLFIHKILSGEPAPPARCETCLQLQAGCTCDLGDRDSEEALRRKFGEYWDIIQS